MSKIVYCIPSLHHAGGMERVLILKVNYLREKYNHDITIITYQNKNGMAPFFPLDDSINIINLSHGNKYKNIINLYAVVNGINPDYFISLGGSEMMFISLLSPNIKSILEWHFCYNQPLLEVKGTRNPLKKIVAYIRQKKNQHCAKKFSLLITLTQRDEQQWKHQGVVNVMTIGNPIIPSNLKKTDNIDYNSKKIQFISAGRLTKQKSFIRMINIFKNANLKRDWELNIYGEGKDFDDIQDEIKSNALEAKVFVHSPIKDLSCKLIESDFFIMTSVYEGLPMVLLESIAVGLPVIAFDCETGPSDIIKNSINGYLIEDNNMDEFSNVLSMLNIGKNYHEMSVNAIETSKKYHIDLVCNQWNDIFTNEI